MKNIYDVVCLVMLPIWIIFLAVQLLYIKGYITKWQKHFDRIKFAKLLYGKDWKAQIKECDEAHLNGSCPLCETTPAQKKG